MYMRLVKLKVAPEHADEWRTYYDERVLPALRGAEGCIFGALTESQSSPEEFISVTLWDSVEHIHAYEGEGEFQTLLRGAESFLKESAEWRVHLDDDLNLTYGPAKEPPAVTCYKLEAGSGDAALDQAASREICLRLLRFNVAPDRVNNVRDTYTRDVLPVLWEVPGCLYACLLRDVGAENQIVSLTMWSSWDAVRKFEQSETYRRMMQLAREAVGAKRWDMMLEMSSTKGPNVPGPEGRLYPVIASRRF